MNEVLPASQIESARDVDAAAFVRLAEAKARNEALKKARALRESYGLDFYRPHIKQHRFHLSSATGRYSRFGNRTGKTKCGAAETVSMCLGARTFYKHSFDILDGNRAVVEHHIGHPEHPYVTAGIPQFPIKALLVCSDWDKAKEIFTNRQGSYDNLGEIFQLIPHEALGKPHTSRGGHIDMIPIKRPREFGGGESLLYIDTVESFKHASLSAESSDWDWIHYDEPPPQQMFIANKRGLTDRNGRFCINATPVTEQWINDEFTPSGRQLLQKVPSEGLRFRKTDRGGDRFIITASIYDNPYISAEGRSEFEASLNAEERECRLFGLPLNLAGLIYKDFIYDLHVLADIPKGWQDFHLPPKDYTIRVAWDVHDAIPQAVLLAATSPSGELFLYDELFFSKLIKDTAVELREKVKNRYVHNYIIDPKAVIESPVTEESVLDVLMQYDFYFDKGSKDMDLGISKVRERLRERREGTQMPTIWISPTCRQLLFEITRYCYNPKTMRPIDKDDHMLENFRRLLIDSVDYVFPPDEAEFISRPVTISSREDLRKPFNVKNLFLS